MTYINSNLLGSHGYCEMDTYLKAYINVKGNINENLLEGILFHEYFTGMFTSGQLNQIGNKSQPLQKAILSSYQKAIYNNWELMVTLNQEPENLFNDFKINFMENESTFITQEMIKYKQKYGTFEFICEKMIYSKQMGIQGKIDRLVRNQKSTHFALYETKTGTSTRSSQVYAYYQCLAYATMLREFYPDTLDAMYIEYPRNPLTERLQLQIYNLVDLHKILEMRNEIWSILIGIQPITGPFKGCGQCFSKDACAFYCYRMFGTANCENDIDKCKYYLYFEANAQRRALFLRMNAYFSWFSELLDRKFSANLHCDE